MIPGMKNLATGDWKGRKPHDDNDKENLFRVDNVHLYTLENLRGFLSFHSDRDCSRLHFRGQGNLPTNLYTPNEMGLVLVYMLDIGHCDGIEKINISPIISREIFISYMYRKNIKVYNKNFLKNYSVT